MIGTDAGRPASALNYMEGLTTESSKDVNLGMFDGEVSHDEINRAIARSPKSVLFGDQTRLPFFPEDMRLSKIHSGDPLVLFFWRVLKKLPEKLRDALIYGPLSLTLVRDDALLHFRDYRHHQAIHIGRRRRTIYLPELLFQKAEEKGYDYWAIAEGIIYAGWMLLDYLLLVDVLKSYSEEVDAAGGFKLSEPYVRGYARRHNHHRRSHPEKAKSEIEEFVDGYRSSLIRIEAVNALSDEPFQLARQVFDAALEQRWAKNKMERIADLFDYPRLFLFDRDIIHGAALQLARDKRQSIEPSCFEDVLHDYRDALRFDPAPLMTTFCKGVVPKPRAIFIMEVVRLGSKGLTGFFAAYRAGEVDVLDLVHPLWMYLCSLSSDPAGVFARVGRCRALARQEIAGGSQWEGGQHNDVQRAVIGILVRLDRSPRYKQLAAEVLDKGELARNELLQVIGLHRLRDEDQWATFRMKKQAIVECVCNLLDQLESAGDGSGDEVAARILDERREVHEDEELMSVLADNPHRHTSDPSAVLMYVRSYKRTLAEFGPADPDTNHLLAAILIRLDRLDNYRQLAKQVLRLGPPAISALNEVLELIPDRDEKRRDILQKARETLGHIMIERHLRATAQEKATASRSSAGDDDDRRPGGIDEAQFVPLADELSSRRHMPGRN